MCVGGGDGRVCRWGCWVCVGGGDGSVCRWR